MANTANFTTSERKYSCCLGSVEYGTGTKYPDGTWSQYVKRAIIANYTETTVITRALTTCAADASSIVMATYDFLYGSITDYHHAYFDYESSSVTSECHRANEAGFYEKTTVTKTCTSITVQ